MAVKFVGASILSFTVAIYVLPGRTVTDGRVCRGLSRRSGDAVESLA